MLILMIFTIQYDADDKLFVCVCLFVSLLLFLYFMFHVNLKKKKKKCFFLVVLFHTLLFASATMCKKNDN